MKVVLFCGGYGMRMRDGTSDTPKPMAMIGSRPLLWNVMRYYAHFGHTEFILCLGYGAKHIKDYFLNYEETLSNDFVLRDGGRDIELLSRDISGWTITFAQTGMETPIGERLRRVRDHLGDDEMFLANYADVLTDLPLDEMIETFAAGDAAATMLAVRPQAAFHAIEYGDDHRISAVETISEMNLRQNGGYFVMRREVLDALDEGDDLLTDTLVRLSKEGKVAAHPYDGFWMPADSVKERAQLENMHNRGHRPWALWDRDRFDCQQPRGDMERRRTPDRRRVERPSGGGRRKWDATARVS
ncbi:MAG: sugar phosphate nucleotidyltransferase [Egibacteraceae bacterium]